MDCKDRNGNIISANDGQDKFLSLLYGTAVGREILKFLIKPGLSKAGGWLLDKPVSRCAVKPFVKANHICLDDYIKSEFNSYNDFFTRRIKPEKRPVDMTPEHFIAPCDSKLSVYKIGQDSLFHIKNTAYSMETLTKSQKLASKYKNGYLFLFRLTVDDYHRYCYVDDGEKSENHLIKGVFHTVNPAASEKYPIYKENTRSFSFLRSDHFGTMMMMEVGALMVGRIVNYHGEKRVSRGEEKGRFEFGGSTVILCVKENRVTVDGDILNNTAQGFETKVSYGEKIGVKAE